MILFHLKKIEQIINRDIIILYFNYNQNKLI